MKYFFIYNTVAKAIYALTLITTSIYINNINKRFMDKQFMHYGIIFHCCNK